VSKKGRGEGASSTQTPLRSCTQKKGEFSYSALAPSLNQGRGKKGRVSVYIDVHNGRTDQHEKNGVIYPGNELYRKMPAHYSPNRGQKRKKRAVLTVTNCQAGMGALFRPGRTRSAAGRVSTRGGEITGQREPEEKRKEVGSDLISPSAGGGPGLRII